MSDTSPQQRVPLPGSERSALPGARQVGPLDPNERIEVSVYLRPPATSNLANEISEQVSHQRRYLTRDEYAAKYSAAPGDLAKVEEFARNHSLEVVEKNATGRVVVLAGTPATISAAFGVELHRYEHEGRTYRGRVGHVYVPSELAPIVQGVFGIDDRPQAQPHLHYNEAATRAFRANTASTSYTPLQVAQLYNFPTLGDGSGQCIAIIELGGGYRTSDLEAYFGQLGIPTPKVSSVSVDRRHNHPTGDPQSADGEVALDIEVVGTIAPGAHIVVYFAPNTDPGFLDAVTTAIHDSTNNPSVISISWGGPESSWTKQSIQVMDQAFQAAAALGVTVCCSAGDHGSGDGASDNLAHVDFPASSPYALGCGGTRLESSNNTVTSEVVWNDRDGWATGGGVSDIFDQPTWQTGANVPHSINDDHVGRGVPDVAGNADSQTGYQVSFGGQTFVIGGTSAVSPLWAGLLALINQQLGQPVGYLNPLLYQRVAQTNALRDVTGGDNGVPSTNNKGYQAGPGWDACTGLGTPDGTNLLKVLAALFGQKGS